MPPTVLDLVVPEGSGPGDAVQFEDESGTMLEAVVPEGFAAGDTFQVEVDGGVVHPLQALNDYVQQRAESGEVMDIFVAWFERESVGEKIDRFIEVNASTIGSSASVDDEQSLDWWPLFQDYQKQFDLLLQEFLDEAKCSADEFLAACAQAEGMNDMYVKLFLAHSEYEMFIEQMSEAYRTQQARKSS